MRATGGTLSLGAGTPIAVTATGGALVDVNRDGKLDAAFITRAGVVWAQGQGDGALRGPGAAVGFGDTAMATGDFNGDGLPDVVTSNALYLNTGAGFAAPRAYTSGNAGAAGVAAGDFNLDGRLDVVTASTSGGGFATSLGDGAGGFTAAVQSSAGTGSTGAIAVADVDRDGRPDVLTSVCGGARNLYLSLGNGNGVAAAQPLGLVGTCGTLALADVTGDGKTDSCSPPTCT